MSTHSADNFEEATPTQAASKTPSNQSVKKRNAPGPPRKNSSPKFTKWFIYSVLFSLLPVLFNGLLIIAIPKNRSQPVTLSRLLSHGDLLLISVAIAAEAIGELISSTSKIKKKDQAKNEQARQIAGGATLFLVIWASLWFAIVGALPNTLNDDVNTFGSIIVFAATLLAAGRCKALTEA